MDLFLGIDMGTSYFKAGLFDANGRLCGLGRQPLQRHMPSGGVCELPVDSFWSTLRRTISEAIQEAGASPQQIIGLSYASQANSFLLFDGQLRALTPLILWPDERAGEIHTDLEAFCGLSAWRVKTGMGIPLSKHSAVNKLLWYQSYPEIFGKISRLLSISDYLTYSLTGQFYSDLSTASLLGLLDVQSGDWWPEAIACVLPGRARVATPLRTGTEVGTLTAEGAGRLGLPVHTKFFLGGLDHHMAAIGAGVHTGHYLSESTGTVLAAIGYSDTYFPAETVCVAPGLDTQHFFNMTFDNNGAAFLEWYRQNKAPHLTITQLLQEAALVAPGSEGLRAAPYAGPGETSYNFEGIGSRHRHGHYVRAILEATAKRLATLANKLDPDKVNRVVSTGGGARSGLWTSIKAAITGRTFILPECSEAACLGAAMMAATGCGLFDNHKEATAHWVKYRSQEEPAPGLREQYLDWLQQEPAPGIMSIKR